MTADITLFSNVKIGLEAELAMLTTVSDGAAAQFLLWRAAKPALVLPERFSRRGGFASATAASAGSGWPVSTRRTGGGITPQGPGVLNLAMAFRVPPKDARSVAATYAAICDPLIDAFAAIDLKAEAAPVTGSFCDGDYNLAINGRKIVGTAQRWRGPSVLCHALILVDLNLAQAVAAAQRLSDGLELGDTYDVAVHTTIEREKKGPTPFLRTLSKTLKRRRFVEARAP
ncbi:MAG: lipoate--protein ligase family protein [Pseudomonadota bacterium]